ncbi:putative adenosine rna-specific isoform adar-a variant [Golovinomyces cichoracearum]|uniref:Putative adenosine rna-specific isoform adar-a variant n=1 Tax=Golovinomyces cichoracearum TaxID=62708 RepID=A0A420IAQ4_9PEZI|nr:putative adenosine rna-specific isoform adar-a variant [Golovinomyces cichoracearum]
MNPRAKYFSPSSNKAELSILDIQDLDVWEGTKMPKSVPGTNQPNPSYNNIVDFEEFYDPTAAERRALEEMGNENWIGKLNEYRSKRVNIGERFDDIYKVNTHLKLKSPRYSCSVKILESPSILCNESNPTTFTGKKPAKQYAAKKAIDWLIQHRFLPADGPDDPTNAVHTDLPSNSSRGSYAAQVPPLCRLLGLNCPRYIIEPVFPGGAIYNATVDFGGDPRITYLDKVMNVYGKKNAKEEIAKSVYDHLSQMHARKNAHIEETRRRLNGPILAITSS